MSEQKVALRRSLFENRNYLLAILTLIYVVNYMDRQILNILLPQIKAEFQLSDTQLGMLAGPVFAVVYSVLGLPMALLADRVSRRKLIAATLAIFSVTTFASAFVTSFIQLLLARFGTGAGEAGTSPAVSSLISDLFPPEKRATALGIYASGLNIGLLIAFFCGGWVAEHYGWRAAFMIAGIPGLILVVLFLLTVQEPRRGAIETLHDSDSAPGLWAAAKHLFAQRSFRFIIAGASLSSFTGYAGLAFNPSYLSRTHGMSPIEIGVMLALLAGVLGFIGTMAAGIIADRLRLGRAGQRAGMLVSMAGVLLALPAFPVFYLADNLTIVIVAAAIPAALSTTYMGPCFAAVQGLAPLRMRAKAQALLLFTVNMVGLGLGPQWVGLVSDILAPRFGDDSLRYAMVTTIIPLAAAAWCFWRAAAFLGEDTGKVTAARAS